MESTVDALVALLCGSTWKYGHHFHEPFASYSEMFAVRSSAVGSLYTGDLAISVGSPQFDACVRRHEQTRRRHIVCAPQPPQPSHTDGWFTPHFSVFASFRISSWLADVACPVVCQPIWPACWLDTPDRTSSSSNRVVGSVWDVYRNELEVVPEGVILVLRDAASGSSVVDFWSIWSRNAELGLFRAYSKAVRPTEPGSSAFLGRGLLRIRNRCLGGRAAGGKGSSRLYRVSRGDEVDVHCAQYFVDSSLSPV